MDGPGVTDNLRGVRLAPDQAPYVGDHPLIDGRGAADSGLLSVWIDRHGMCTADDAAVSAPLRLVAERGGSDAAGRLRRGQPIPLLGLR